MTQNDEIYYGQDGLLYCKKCNKPRQQKILIAATCEAADYRIVPAMCDCQKAAQKKREQELEMQRHNDRVNDLRKQGLPNVNYRAMTFANDDGADQESMRIAKAYVDKFDECRKTGQGLLFFGGIGTGKTYMAMAIANALIEKEIKVVATNFSKIVSIAQDFDDADDNFDWLMQAKAIVIDDLGTERGTEFANEQIYKFVDACNLNNIPLIITTNITPSNLQKVVDESADPTFARIYSRILEKCFAVKVNKIKRRAENQSRNKAAMAKLLGVAQ